MTETPLKQPRNWRDLGPRLGSAVVMLGLGILVIVSGHKAFVVLLAVMAVIGAWEFYNMAHHKLRESGSLMAEDLYALGAYFILFILGLAGLWGLSMAAGPAGLLYIVALVVATDSMGYFVGRTVGGKKFWPSISPKKTWSGVIGGWLGAAMVASLVAVLMQGMHIGILQGVMIVVFSVFLSFASQLGDIAQSAVKRRMGIKDSSNIIPGHGGVLDRFDALLAVGAVLFFLRLIMWGAS